MEIRWNNIIAFVLLLIALVLLVKCLPEITAFMASMKHLGPSHSTDDKVFGLIAFGLVGVLLVAIVRILSNNSK
jgi:hypothetical protein